VHGLSQEWGEVAHEVADLLVIWKLLLQILHLPRQVTVAMLDVTGGFVVALVPIDPRRTGGQLPSLFSNRSRSLKS